MADEADRKAPERIDAAFRNGSLTAIGILLGFSIGFAVQWANESGPWTIFDIAIGLPLGVGVVIQIKALADLLEIDSLEVPVYRRAKKRFMLGLVVTSASILAVIAFRAFDARAGIGLL